SCESVNEEKSGTLFSICGFSANCAGMLPQPDFPVKAAALPVRQPRQPYIAGSPARDPEAGRTQDPPEIATQSSALKSAGSVRVRGGDPERKKASPRFRPVILLIAPVMVIGKPRPSSSRSLLAPG